MQVTVCDNCEKPSKHMLKVRIDDGPDHDAKHNWVECDLCQDCITGLLQKLATDHAGAGAAAMGFGEFLHKCRSRQF